MVNLTQRTPNEQAAWDLIRRRRQGYQHTFNKEDRFARDVLADLARFCKGGSASWHADPAARDVIKGRQEVWERIAQHINLTEPELYELLALGKK